MDLLTEQTKPIQLMLMKFGLILHIDDKAMCANQWRFTDGPEENNAINLLIRQDYIYIYLAYKKVNIIL